LNPGAAVAAGARGEDAGSAASMRARRCAGVDSFNSAAAMLWYIVRKSASFLLQSAQVARCASTSRA
jgi:hypothetical protein